MSVAAGLVGRLAAAGVSLFLEGGRLRYRAQRGAYSDELRALVDAHRQELVTLLEGREEKESPPPSTSPSSPSRAAEDVSDNVAAVNVAATATAVPDDEPAPTEVGPLAAEVAAEVSASTAYAKVQEVLAEGRRRSRDRPGRERLLEVFAALAKRWHEAGDVRLFEIEQGVVSRFEEWQEEDQVEEQEQVAARRRDLPSGWW